MLKMKSSSETVRALPEPSVPVKVYQELVDRCARDRLNYPIANGSALHARILIDKLFEIAKDDVCLVTGSLRQASTDGIDIYAHSRVIESAKKFLGRRGSTLSIVLQKGELDKGEQNAFLREIVEDKSRKGDIRVFFPRPGALSPQDTPHFMVSDRAAYRFETGKDANPANESITAIANFGDGKTANVLADIFQDTVALVRSDGNLKKKCVYAPQDAFAI